MDRLEYLEALERQMEAERGWLGAQRGGVLAVAVGLVAIYSAGNARAGVFWLGVLLVVCGAGTMLAGAWWYGRWRRLADVGGSTPLPRAAVWGIAALLAMLSLALLALV